MRSPPPAPLLRDLLKQPLHAMQKPLHRNCTITLFDEPYIICRVTRRRGCPSHLQVLAMIRVHQAATSQTCIINTGGAVCFARLRESQYMSGKGTFPAPATLPDGTERVVVPSVRGLRLKFAGVAHVALQPYIDPALLGTM